MKRILYNDSALKGYTGPGTTWANGMNFVIDYTPGAGSIARNDGTHNYLLEHHEGQYGKSTFMQYTYTYLNTMKDSMVSVRPRMDRARPT